MKLSHLIAIAPLFIAAASNAAPNATEAVLNAIANSADVGNGSAKVEPFSVPHFDRAAEMHKMDKLRTRGCGPWKQTQYRRDTIALITQADKATADKLTALYDQKKVLAMIGLSSNNNIECSLIYLEVFTTDGFELDLSYNMGD